MKNTKQVVQTSTSAGGGAYFFGMIGAAVYYLQAADGFWSVIAALLKALVWPGFLVYDVLKFIS